MKRAAAFLSEQLFERMGHLEILPGEARVHNLHMLGGQGDTRATHLRKRQRLLANCPPVCLRLRTRYMLPLHAPLSPDGLHEHAACTS